MKSADGVRYRAQGTRRRAYGIKAGGGMIIPVRRAR